MGFIWFRRICTVLLCLLLAATFWLPQRVLSQYAAQWYDKIDAASDALHDGDSKAAAAHCAELAASYRQRRDVLERFLNHDTVTAVMCAAGEAEVFAQVGDAPGALAALATMREGIEMLVRIERFTWNALL